MVILDHRCDDWDWVGVMDVAAFGASRALNPPLAINLALLKAGAAQVAKLGFQHMAHRSFWMREKICPNRPINALSRRRASERE